MSQFIELANKLKQIGREGSFDVDTFFSMIDSSDVNFKINGIQEDNTLIPITGSTSSSYIIKNLGSINSGFGSTSGWGINDIVNYDTVEQNFKILLDASSEKQYGTIVFNLDDSKFYGFTGSNWTEITTGIGSQGFQGVTGPTGEPGTSSEAIDVYDASGGQTITNSVTTLTLDTIRYNSGGGAFTLSSNKIIFNVAMRALINFRVTTRVETTDRCTTRAYLQKNPSGFGTPGEISGSRIFMYNRTSGDSNDKSTGSATVILEVEAGDSVEIKVNRSSTEATNTVTTQAYASGMTIFNLKGGERGPTGPESRKYFYGDTAPLDDAEGLTLGSKWFNTEVGGEFTYLNDPGNNPYWVMTNVFSATGPQGFQGPEPRRTFAGDDGEVQSLINAGEGEYSLIVNADNGDVWNWDDTGLTWSLEGNIKGVTGDTGLTGERGLRTKIVKTIIDLGGLLSDSLEGDSAIVSDTGDLYKYRASGGGSYGIQGSLIGPTGGTGDIGATGFQGFQGHTGFQGFQGFIGSTGFQGFTGPTGFQGFQGTQGPTGPQGFQGTQGPTGIIGSINGFTDIETLSITGGNNLSTTQIGSSGSLTITINEDEPENSYGMTQSSDKFGNPVGYDRLSFLFARGENSVDVGSLTGDNIFNIERYYYSNDIQYDGYNKITTLFRFSEKIHDNGSPTASTSGGPWDINLDNGTLQFIDLTSSTTGTAKYFSFNESITNDTAYNSSQSFLLMLLGGDELTINWPSNVKFESNLGSPQLGTASQMTVIPFTYIFGNFPTGVTGWLCGDDLKYNI